MLTQVFYEAANMSYTKHSLQVNQSLQIKLHAPGRFAHSKCLVNVHLPFHKYLPKCYYWALNDFAFLLYLLRIANLSI